MFLDVSNKIDKFFPTPKFLSFNSVSLDIGPRHIRVMKLKNSKHGLIPEFYKEIKLVNKNDLSNFGSKKDIDSESLREIVEALKNLKKEFGFSFVVVSLPETNTYIYRTTLPKEAASDVASAIRFKLEENVPLKADDVNFDYFVIDSDRGGGDDLEVVVTVFPKEIIGLYTKVLKMAGLFPLAFQSESVSMVRSMVKVGDKDPYLLLRFLKDQINVGIVEDEAIQYASIIQIDMDDVINDFKSEQAEILNETLNRTLIFWFTTKKDLVQHSKIETALISGEYALSPGLKEFLEQKLKINIQVADVWSNCFAVDKFVPKLHKKNSLDYSVAIGLAIKGITHA